MGRHRSPSHSAPPERIWYLVSSHGTILFYIATHPDCTISQISDDLFLTKRTVYGVVGDLRGADMVSVRPEGRRHHYRINLDAPLKHPLWQGRTIREMAVRAAQGAMRLSELPPDETSDTDRTA